MKNKKVIFYRSAYFLFFILSLSAIIGFAVYAVVISIIALLAISRGAQTFSGITQIEAIGGLIGAFAFIFGISYEIIIVLRRMIVVNEETVFSNLNIKFKYKSKVDFTDISKIDLVFEYRKLRKRGDIYHKKHAFLVFYNQKESAKYFDVNYYSKKQVIKIIDTIRERMKAVGNTSETLSGEELMQIFEDKYDKYIYRISGGFPK